MTTVTRWGPYVERRLDEIRDGKGREHWEGEWPSAAAVSLARDWAARLFPDGAPPPSVAPTGEGSVWLAWLKGGWHVEVVVDEYQAVMLMYKRGTGEDYFATLEAGGERLRAVLGELAAI